MPIKITCPHCGSKNALSEPLPLPGSQTQCSTCAARLAISYPAGVMEALAARGKRFQDDVTGDEPPRRRLVGSGRRTPPPAPRRDTPAGGGWLGFLDTTTPSEQDALQSAPAPPPRQEAPPTDDAPATRVDRGPDGTIVQPMRERPGGDPDRTVASGRSPWGTLPDGIPEADGGSEGPTEIDHDDAIREDAPTQAQPVPARPKPAPPAAEPAASARHDTAPPAAPVERAPTDHAAIRTAIAAARGANERAGKDARAALAALESGTRVAGATPTGEVQRAVAVLQGAVDRAGAAAERARVAADTAGTATDLEGALVAREQATAAAAEARAARIAADDAVHAIQDAVERERAARARALAEARSALERANQEASEAVAAAERAATAAAASRDTLEAAIAADAAVGPAVGAAMEQARAAAEQAAAALRAAREAHAGARVDDPAAAREAARRAEQARYRAEAAAEAAAGAARTGAAAARAEAEAREAAARAEAAAREAERARTAARAREWAEAARVAADEATAAARRAEDIASEARAAVEGVDAPAIHRALDHLLRSVSRVVSEARSADAAAARAAEAAPPLADQPDPAAAQEAADDARRGAWKAAAAEELLPGSLAALSQMVQAERERAERERHERTRRVERARAEIRDALEAANAAVERARSAQGDLDRVADPDGDATSWREELAGAEAEASAAARRAQAAAAEVEGVDDSSAVEAARDAVTRAAKAAERAAARAEHAAAEGAQAVRAAADARREVDNAIARARATVHAAAEDARRVADTARDRYADLADEDAAIPELLSRIEDAAAAAESAAWAVDTATDPDAAAGHAARATAGLDTVNTAAEELGRVAARAREHRRLREQRLAASLQAVQDLANAADARITDAAEALHADLAEARAMTATATLMARADRVADAAETAIAAGRAAARDAGEAQDVAAAKGALRRANAAVDELDAARDAARAIVDEARAERDARDISAHLAAVEAGLQEGQRLARAAREGTTDLDDDALSAALAHMDEALARLERHATQARTDAAAHDVEGARIGAENVARSLDEVREAARVVEAATQAARRAAAERARAEEERRRAQEAAALAAAEAARAEEERRRAQEEAARAAIERARAEALVRAERAATRCEDALDRAREAVSRTTDDALAAELGALDRRRDAIADAVARIRGSATAEDADRAADEAERLAGEVLRDSADVLRRADAAERAAIEIRAAIARAERAAQRATRALDSLDPDADDTAVRDAADGAHAAAQDAAAASTVPDAQRAAHDAEAAADRAVRAAEAATHRALSQRERARHDAQATALAAAAERGRAAAERAAALVHHAERLAADVQAPSVTGALAALADAHAAVAEAAERADRRPTSDLDETDAIVEAAQAAATEARERLVRVEAAATEVERTVTEARAARAAESRAIVASLSALVDDAEALVAALDDEATTAGAESPGVTDAVERARAHAVQAREAVRQLAGAGPAAPPEALDPAARAVREAVARAKRAVEDARDAITAEMDARAAAAEREARLSVLRAEAQQAAHDARSADEAAARRVRDLPRPDADTDALFARVAELRSGIGHAVEAAATAAAAAAAADTIDDATRARDHAVASASRAQANLAELAAAAQEILSTARAPLPPVPQPPPASRTLTPPGPRERTAPEAISVDPDIAQAVDADATADAATVRAAPKRSASPVPVDRASPPPLPTPAPAATSQPPPPIVTPPATPSIAPAAEASTPPPRTAPAPRRRRRWLRRIALAAVVLLGITAATGVVVGVWGYLHYSKDLPTVEALQAYEPPTVTTVYDHEGKLLGEIYEYRRYVRPIEEIPKHVQDAFIAAEDSKFWKHGGVDWVGLVRATLALARTGEKSQGASTITMQVTRNFLLSSEKTYERKIKEIILARRIESVYDKEHILYLYLNEIYLGSGAYGVEAAARTYFDKHVEDLTLAEAALIAGLPPAPSTYSPHRNFAKAKERQEYVLEQMVDKGYITRAEMDEALAEELVIVERTNEFLEMAPYFTEHVRRYLVDTYGHDRVYNEGLQVTTTCDLDLQKVAQQAVVDGVYDVDQRMGFRRTWEPRDDDDPGRIETLSPEEIPARRAAIEAEMREAWAEKQDPAGRRPPPERSVLEPGEFYTGILTEVHRTYARVAIGDHEGIIPLAWSEWVYEPNPRRSWRYRTQTDLTEPVDMDGDGIKEGGILRVGDVVKVRVAALSTKDEAVASAFRGTPGETEDLVAVRLWQDPEVEAALLSYDLNSGAVRAMVGGADFENSEFNRATQSYRQVGSTFKPIVYAAAIESRKVTAATMVTDGPLAFATDQEFIWKPANYGNDYLGNLTLRKALAMSRNTCTVRVLERIDPGMNDDVVYKFVRRLGIGGPPTHTLPPDHVPTPENDHLCPWVRETPESTICMDRYPPKDPNLSNTAHRRMLGPDDVYMCRACDLSMGLGSASLTMPELMRAYSSFATAGTLVEPYFIEEVRDRDGNVLERHEPEPPVQVIDPAVASITTWLLEGVVNGGTASRASRLGLNIAGKTGTTNDEKDAWFVGYNPDVITAVWVGYDQPRTLGISSTGGRTALPIWMEYMAAAIPKERDRPFEMRGDIEWAQIEEETGRRVTSGGRPYPFLRGTAPESSGVEAGQASIEDLTTEL